MPSLRYLSVSIIIMSLAAFPPSLVAEAPAPIAGTVTRVDLAGGTVTIKHGPIANLGLNQREQTDEFKVRDAVMLNAVGVGNEIMFTADRIGGQLTITAIVPSKK